MVCAEVEPKVIESKEESPSTMNDEVLREFVKNNTPPEALKNLFKIDKTNTHDNFFRINVWLKFLNADQVVPSFRIFESFFVELAENGDIIDLTERN